ncbi:ferredoxin, partial [bacterium]
MKSHKVLFKPEGKEVEITEGKTILEAANQAGVYISSECG